ncbi:hypothetical protein EFW17_08900 [Halostreptopolyspora alba]|uniref:Tetratricopeptide repeat protein n=1 Tax=Halostreptopolyspora alba TaxID=2487137 RepID=A0A3N0EC68_9ACTN|nr:hypothetical protein EFW17_08900 [Nocardiopsaceae bacterium YIM 96095]
MTDESRPADRDGSGPQGGNDRHSGGSGRGGGGERSRSDSGRDAARGGYQGGGARGPKRDERSGRNASGRGGSGASRDGDRSGAGRFDRKKPAQGRDRSERGDRKGGDPRRGGGRSGGKNDQARRSQRSGSRDDRGTDRQTPAKGEPKSAPAPKLPDEIKFTQLDREIFSELSTLPRSLAETIARHLVMAREVLDDDPDLAYEHATYARRKASRIGAVREVSGLAAYRVGKWQEALSDLRAARRITGRNSFLPVIADCERGLGRAERALEVTRSRDVETLDVAERIELRIVAAGARRDLGQLDAALVELHVPELKERRARPWVARLFYAYADVLLELGREKTAREYFARASAVDQEGVTDADERLAALEGLEIVEMDDDVIWTDAEDPDPEAGPEVGAQGPETASGAEPPS